MGYDGDDAEEKILIVNTAKSGKSSEPFLLKSMYFIGSRNLAILN